jgi:Tol biopolymer transport system component
MHRRSVITGALGGLVTLLASGSLAVATSIPQRTLIGSSTATGESGNGSSDDPVLSSSGRVVAFDTTASNVGAADANGAIRDVVAIDLATNERRLVSSSPEPGGANGPSVTPSLSGDGQQIAFTSAASNLLPGDTNGQPDVFVRKGRDPLRLVSVGMGGVPANGPSYEPDVSADGTRIVFTSLASNLVPGDTNGQADIFVRDMSTGTTTRVSVGAGGAQANNRSLAAAISANGKIISFSSAASNLVARDTNGLFDVFVRDLSKGTTERVSVNTKGRQQERAVAPGFNQVSDLSDDGRYVVFESDSTRLYTPDTNQHTDIFLRDRKKKRTTLVSANSGNQQGNNDSFAPRISANGRYLIFESFASKLAGGDNTREDIFLRDLRQGTTIDVTATANGAPRGPEQVRELLQRPAVSNNGRVAAFASTVPSLAPGDANNAQDVFLRLLDPPVGRIVSHPSVNRLGTLKFAADDPLATRFLCQFDNQRPFLCGLGFKLTRPLGHILKVRAGGAGMLFDNDVLKVRLNSDYRPPKVTISANGATRVIRGRASDRSGIYLVRVGFALLSPKGCRSLTKSRKFTSRYSMAECKRTKLLDARGKTRWSLRLPRRISQPYVVYARAIDRLGNGSDLIFRIVRP